jgi:hypothetical protein
MAGGIQQALLKDPLMTYHPEGGSSSSQWFQNDAWLDFNMLQSGHNARDLPNWEWIANDYGRSPTKPIIDGEANYEDHLVNKDSAKGYFTDYDVRKQAYRAVFAGAFGHTYGHNSIWQFYAPGREPLIDARVYWSEAMDYPGAIQVGYLRKLMESRPFLNRIPAQNMLVSLAGTGADHVQATRAVDGSYAMFYIPTSQTVTINPASLSGSQTRAWWYNPRNGTATLIGTYPAGVVQAVTPPTDGPDWVLVLDDAAQPFGLPGEQFHDGAAAKSR